MYPESTPGEGDVKGWQGFAKVDCVTVWFFERNRKDTVSPVLASTLVGLYARVPFSPTRTKKSSAETRAARETRRTEEARIAPGKGPSEGCK